MKFNKKKKNEKLNGPQAVSFLFFFAFVFLIVFLTLSNMRMFQRRSDLNTQFREKEDEMAALYQKLHSDFKGKELEDYNLERIIREQLLMKREGEEVVFVSFPEEFIFNEEEIKEEKNFIWWNPFTWKKD